MKIRSGFVSNSSSSSFVIISTKENFENKEKKLEGKIKEFVEELKLSSNFREFTFMNTPMVSISGFSTPEGESEFSVMLDETNVELSEEDEETIIDDYYAFLEDVCKDKNVSYKEEIGW